MKKTLWTLAALTLLQAGAASAGTITVANNSSITIPQTRVYKTCLGSFAAQLFGNLAPGDLPLTQTRTSLVQGGCAWAREVGVEPRYISCSTGAAVIPSDPSEIIVTWTGTSADNAECSISVIE
jgi:type 1 fimbria pilin